MYRVNTATLNLIKKFEGCVLHVYKDAVGLPTIGVGHLITDGEVFDTITQEEADNLLQMDLRVAIRGVFRNIRVPLTDNQYGALISYTFNLGSGCLQRSTLRSRINRDDLDVYSEFLKYNKAGIPLRAWKGLTRRRIAEANLFSSHL